MPSEEVSPSLPLPRHLWLFCPSCLWLLLAAVVRVMVMMKALPELSYLDARERSHHWPQHL